MVEFQISEELRGRYGNENIGLYLKGLEEAVQTFCSPQVSDFWIQAATIWDVAGERRAIRGGNTEYRDPRAIHGETSLVNHVINRYGGELTKEFLEFIALHSSFGPVTPCGDCRDYLLASTDPTKLVIVSAGEKDPNVQIHPFTDFLAPEEGFEVVRDRPTKIGDIVDADFYHCWTHATDSQNSGGINLFEEAITRAAVAARKTVQGYPQYYTSASCDDAAFHLRGAVGGALQAAASDGAYFVDFIAAVRSDGKLPRIIYRDRQYAVDMDGFNKITGRPPLKLVLDGEGGIRVATLDKALPHSFSTVDFAPEKVEAFLKSRGAL